jgi:pyrimidine deaminase RibD-like protein
MEYTLKPAKKLNRKGSTHYFTGEPCKHGHIGPCEKLKGLVLSA